MTAKARVCTFGMEIFSFTLGADACSFRIVFSIRDMERVVIRREGRGGYGAAGATTGVGIVVAVGLKRTRRGRLG